MRRISEVNTIPDIRERNDRPKDKQPKHQVTSTVQRQMVQKFVKELSDSAKQPDRSDSAERTATEQVETTVREIVHEAVQLPRRAIQHPARRESADSSADIQPKQSDQSHHAPEPPRQRADAPRTRPEPQHPQSASAAVPQEQTRRAYVQQAAKKFTTAPPIIPEQSQPQYPTVSAPLAENAPRTRTDDLRTRPKPKQPQSIPTSTPQEQGRCAYVRQAKKSRAEKPSARDHLHTEQPEIRLADSAPQKEIPAIREKPDAPEMRGQVQSEAAQEKPSAVRHVKQPGAWTPRSSAAPVMRGKEQSIRERSAVTQAHDLLHVPQAQARQVFVEKQAQLSQNPSIHPNRLPLFCRSRLFRKHPQLRRSVSRSRLAAANRPHLSRHHHRRKIHQRSTRPPSVKNRSQTPRRERNPSAALIFGHEKQSRSAPKRRSQKHLHQKLRQNVHGKR